MTGAAHSITSLLAGLSRARLRALFSQTPERAADWVQVTAMEGLPQAQVCFGRMLLEGTGRPKDLPAALAWFRRAAARGDLDAINMVGRCLDNGWGTQQDPAAAAGHYHRAADSGTPGRSTTWVICTWTAEAWRAMRLGRMRII